MAECTAAQDDSVNLRRSDNTERFVAFAFAAADLVVEVEPSGEITFAAGAFRARLREQPDNLIGRKIHTLVSPRDHGALEMALALLGEKGRLSPLLVRLATREMPQFALAGIALAPVGHPTRYCLTFALPPEPLLIDPAPSPAALTREANLRMQAGAACEMGFIEMAEGSSVSGQVVRQALKAISPEAFASELAPGRFGVLGSDTLPQLGSVLRILEQTLRTSGGNAVLTQSMALQSDGLTGPQTARALGQALIVFARDGRQGLDKAGFAGGLAGYVAKAAKHSTALRRAIKERRFELVYQPIVGLKDRTLHHFEALVRPEPIRSCPFSSPQEFVLLAETLGLIEELDLAVAELACTAAARAPAPIAFNISGHSVQSSQFRAKLLPILTKGNNAGRVMVEMTETAEISNLAEARETVQALKLIGVQFCLDDFGTGSSDVRILRALPADTVKLDGSFVQGVVEGGRERALVLGIIEIARATGAAVVAERIETEEQAKALLAIGANYGQGWLFGKPGPLEPSPHAASRRTGERESWG